MLCQQREVGSSSLPNTGAKTAKLKWNVLEVPAVLEQADRGRRPRTGEGYSKISIIHTAQGPDH